MKAVPPLPLLFLQSQASEAVQKFRITYAAVAVGVKHTKERHELRHRKHKLKIFIEEVGEVFHGKLLLQEVFQSRGFRGVVVHRHPGFGPAGRLR